jgi:hypothetical protein
MPGRLVRRIYLSLLELVPDSFVDPLEIALARREQIHQQMNTLTNQLNGLLNKGAPLGAAGLIARRYDFDDRLQGQDIWDRATDVLFHPSEIVGRQTPLFRAFRSATVQLWWKS